MSALQLYQQRISPLIGPKCSFKPSCSRYSAHAIRNYGMLRGLVMTADRLLRCHYCAGLYYPRERGLLLNPVIVQGDDGE
ncbi:MAG: membrane protein insertion efficiency factor YidD [Candidatus Omnitrophota bacterium]|nr:membrane protein insertion efficiency factor YidD [Candidatus Omnitrophota bacterium]